MRVCPSCHSIYATQVDHCGLDGSRLVDDADDPLIGQTVGRFVVMDRLGSGAMGCVYRARHVALEREFALKLMFGEVSADPNLGLRFMREAKTLSQVDHPNIISIVEFGVTPRGLNFFATELVDGPTLAEVISADAPIDIDRAAAITRQIAAGLSEAHAQGYVHRDLKPANVMLTARADGELVKILDFGISSAIAGLEDEARLTATGLTLGTPAYMAPEQIRSSSVGPSADLYSLGVILYEMLSGAAPFDGTPSQVMLKHVTEPPPPIPEEGPLGALAMWMLNKAPEGRPPSALDVIRFIDERVRSSGPAFAVFDTAVLPGPAARSVVEQPLDDGAEPPAAIDAVAARSAAEPPKRTRPLAAAAGLVLGAGLVIGAYGLLDGATPEPHAAVGAAAGVLATVDAPDAGARPAAAPQADAAAVIAGTDRPKDATVAAPNGRTRRRDGRRRGGQRRGGAPSKPAKGFVDFDLSEAPE